MSGFVSPNFCSVQHDSIVRVLPCAHGSVPDTCSSLAGLEFARNDSSAWKVSEAGVSAFHRAKTAGGPHLGCSQELFQLLRGRTPRVTDQVGVNLQSSA